MAFTMIDQVLEYEVAYWYLGSSPEMSLLMSSRIRHTPAALGDLPNSTRLQTCKLALPTSSIKQPAFSISLSLFDTLQLHNGRPRLDQLPR